LLIEKENDKKFDQKSFNIPNQYFGKCWLVLLRWQEFEAQSVAVFLLTCHRSAGASGGGRC